MLSFDGDEVTYFNPTPSMGGSAKVTYHRATFQPAILIKVGDGQATRFEDAPAPKAGRGVLLDGNGDGDIVRER
jgi:hypothetical protein